MMNLANAYRKPHPGRQGREHRAGHRRLRASLAGDDPPGHARGVGADHENLALAYYSRIRGDKAENIEHAIAGYEQALQVMTRQAMPVEWATTMMNLATAYSDRIRGDKARTSARHRRLRASLAGEDPPGHARGVGATMMTWRTPTETASGATRPRTSSAPSPATSKPCR